MLAVLAAGTLGASFVTWRLSHEFAWYEQFLPLLLSAESLIMCAVLRAIYRHIADANLALRRMYLIHEVGAVSVSTFNYDTDTL